MRTSVAEGDPDHNNYFTYHHSAGDSMDIMNPDSMDDNVIAIASMMFIIADMDERLPRS
jgi:carboxypeptidase Q